MDTSRKLLSAAFGCLLTANISAYNTKVDSLLSSLKTVAADTHKVVLLNELAWEFRGQDAAKAGDYAEEALAIARKLKFQSGEVTALNRLGNALEIGGKYNDAITRYTDAAALCEKISPNSNRLAGIYNNIGIAYSSLTDYPQAIYFMKKALQIKIALGDEIKIAGQLHNIGIIYYYIGQLDKAHEYYFDALKIFEKHGDQNKLAECCNSIGAAYSAQKNYSQALKYLFKSLEIFIRHGDKIQLANAYDNIGEIQIARGIIDSAEGNIRKALELRESLGFQKGVADCYNELGDICAKRQQYSNAMEYKLKALQIFEEAGNKREQADCLGDIGYLCSYKKQYSEAIDWFQKSIAIGEASNIKSVLYNSYAGITSAYENTGQYKTALECHRKYAAIADTIFNENKTKKISELEMQYQVDKKEEQNQLLAKENQLQAVIIRSEKEKRKNQFIVLLIVMAFIIFASLFFYTRYRYHHLSLMEEEKRRQEQLRFKTVIDAEEKERARIATELHDGLGQLLSSAKLNVAGLEEYAVGNEKKLFDNSMNLIDEACNEVRAVSHNLMPAALMRQGLVPAIRNLAKKINDTGQIKVVLNETTGGQRLEPSTEIALYRIIQEILNNMLKHSMAKNIQIGLQPGSNQVFLAVKDDGVGFDVSKIQESSGIGWKNILSRVDMAGGHIAIDTQNGKGTSVKIEIPI